MSGPVGTSLTLSGSNFGKSPGAVEFIQNGNTVNVAGSAGAWADTNATVAVPSGLAAGSTDVAVYNAADGLVSQPSLFTVTAPSVPPPPPSPSFNQGTGTILAQQATAVTVFGANGNKVTVTIPGGSISQGVQLVLQVLSQLPTAVGTLPETLSVVTLSATTLLGTGVHYMNHRVTVTMQLTEAPTGPVVVVYWNPLLKAWVPVPDVTVAGSTVTFTTTHFTTFAVVPAAGVAQVTRVAGITRMATAVQSAYTAFPDGASAVVLVNAGTGTASPDALSAAGLAGALHAPILLTTADSLSTGDLTAIQNLKAETVYVIGGPLAVGPAVIQTLKKAGLTVVEQFMGANRFDTADLVAQYLYANHLTQSTTVYLANGVTMVDALSASPVTYRQGAPLLLVSSHQTTLSAKTMQWLQAQGFANVVILGGPHVVSAELAIRLSQALSRASVTRWNGTTRDSTAVAIDQYNFPSPDGVIVSANGSQGGSFVDALSAAELAAMNDIPIVLTNPSGLPASTSRYLKQQTTLHMVWVMGGPAAIRHGVLTALQSSFSNP